MQKLYVTFYCLPINATVGLLIAAVLVWASLCRWVQGRKAAHRRLAKAVLALAWLLWLVMILHSTVFSRTAGEVVVYSDPFHQLREYLRGGSSELLRVLWMNVLLFVPGGVWLEALWPERWPRWRCAVLTTALLTGLSVGVETAQYVYALGYVEADDVLCNGLGAALGMLIHETCRRSAATARHRGEMPSDHR